jgi:hypothetical protein
VSFNACFSVSPSRARAEIRAASAFSLTRSLLSFGSVLTTMLVSHATVSSSNVVRALRRGLSDQQRETQHGGNVHLPTSAPSQLRRGKR